jgi:hypothetical protein
VLKAIACDRNIIVDDRQPEQPNNYKCPAFISGRSRGRGQVQERTVSGTEQAQVEKDKSSARTVICVF